MIRTCRRGDFTREVSFLSASDLCVNLHVQISWQAQHFVNVHVQISLQAQHLGSWNKNWRLLQYNFGTRSFVLRGPAIGHRSHNALMPVKCISRT